METFLSGEFVNFEIVVAVVVVVVVVDVDVNIDVVGTAYSLRFLNGKTAYYTNTQQQRLRKN